MKKYVSLFWNYLDKFDTSQDKAIKFIRYELYIIGIIVISFILIKLVFESWLMFTFVPIGWFKDVIPEIQGFFNPLIQIGTYEFNIVSFLPYLWFIVSFFITTIIGFKIKQYFRNKVIKLVEKEEK